ncbi:MAG: FTR1 family protein [Cellvibrio sp.]
MVDAVLLILREVLEAALIVSLLLALTYKLNLHYQWSLAALGCGLLGSVTLAHYASSIAEALDGQGQELLNIVLYTVVIICVLWVGFLITRAYFFQREESDFGKKLSIKNNSAYFLIVLSSVIVSFSLAREGSEIWIYFSGFAIQSQSFYSVLIGAAIGVGIGMSLGAITYYLLAFMQEKYFTPVFLIVITLLSGGLSLQVAKQFMQIGVLDSNGPLWNSSFLVEEKSWVGELLYALFGYDAQPNAVQAYFYIAATLPMVISVIWNWHATRKGHAKKS